MTQAFRYPGEELALFAAARAWPAYLRGQLGALGPRVLEVGAGRGSQTRALCGEAVTRWLCLDPDPAHGRILQQRIQAGELPAVCRVFVGRLGDLPPGPTFDSLLYLDVLEHIEDDRAELAAAAARLAPGGRLIVVAPAFQALFSPLDRAVGHWRRYDKGSLRAVVPPGLVERRCRYLDSLGALASLANRLLLRQRAPGVAQFAFWDRWLVPGSRRLDPLLGHRVGRSLLWVGQRPV